MQIKYFMKNINDFWTIILTGARITKNTEVDIIKLEFAFFINCLF